MADAWTGTFRDPTAAVTTLVTGLWLGLLVTGIGGQLWLAVLVAGYAGVVPAVGRLYGTTYERPDEEPEPRVHDAVRSTNEDALETLRKRYAAGELTDDQFEHKLERLLGTETVEDADEWARGRGDDRQGRSRDDEWDLERE